METTAETPGKTSFEEYLVDYCSPTLCGMKTANLFRVTESSCAGIREQAAYWNRQLASRDISVRIMHEREEKGEYLIYVYRRKWLANVLRDGKAGAFLRENGYEMAGVEQMLDQLSARIREDGNFPHEVGIFLGYPLTDVVGFIQNHGRNYTCSGYWKSYGEPDRARRRFDVYRDCFRSCREQFRNGRGVMQMVVA